MAYQEFVSGTNDEGVSGSQSNPQHGDRKMSVTSLYCVTHTDKPQQ